MQTPLVSVIIPTHNDEAFIAASVESVLKQSYDKLELIVINDGSSDGTLAQLESINDPRLSVTSTPNQGVAAARNLGIEAASGSIVCFLDGDDLWDSNKLALDVEIFVSHPEINCIFSDLRRFESDTGRLLARQFQFMPELETLHQTSILDGKAYRIEDPAFLQLIQLNEFPTMLQSMAFRKSALDGILFSEPVRDAAGRLLFDEISDFGLRVFLNGGVAWHKGVMAQIRRHPQNMSALVESIVLAKQNMLVELSSLSLDEASQAALRERLARQRIHTANYWLSSRRSIAKAARELLLAASAGRVLSAIKTLAMAPIIYSRGAARE